MGKEEEEEEEEEEIIWNLEGVMRFPMRRDQLVGRVCVRGGDIQEGFVRRFIRDLECMNYKRDDLLAFKTAIV